MIDRASTEESETTVLEAAIPAALRALPQWVSWDYEAKAGQAKPTKVPYAPRDGSTRAKVNRPITWGSFEDAIADVAEGWRAGVGFVLAADDPFVGIDLDGCRDRESGELESWARAIVDRLDSYTEVSSSGTGVRIFVRGALPNGRAHVERKDRGAIEVYDRVRFMTLTGRVIGSNAEVEDRQEALTDLVGANAEAAPAPNGHPVLIPDAGAVAQTLRELTGRLGAAGVGFRQIRRDYGTVLDLEQCLTSDQHSGGAYVVVYRDGYPVYRCHHNSCRGKDWSEVEPILGPRPRKILPLSDAGNAVRMLRRHGHDLRYVAVNREWLIWDGKRWVVDRTLRVKALAKETAISIYDEAKEAARWGDADLQKKLASWAVYSQNEKQINAMVASLASEPGIGITPEELDAHPELLNFPNGTLDLRTLQLRPHDRTDLLTKLTGADYAPGTRSETFERFLSDSTEGVPEVRGFLQRLAGHTLVGKNTEEVMVFLLGGAGSGKTTLLQAMKAAWGDYAKEADFESFVASDCSRGGQARGDLARLAGARYVLSSEPDPNKKLDLSKLKAMTGGEALTVRHMYKDDFEMEPAFTPWIAANEAPRIDDTDGGIWRRLLRVPMENNRPLGQRDPSIKAELTDASTSGAAILAWAVEGLREWRANGLQIPAIVLQRTEELREEMNPLHDFFESRCVVEDGAEVKASAFYAAYTSWTRGMGIRYPISQRGFSNRLTAKGFQKRKKRDADYWQGIGLMPLAEIIRMERDDEPSADSGGA